jgi:hypothetical protein
MQIWADNGFPQSPTCSGIVVNLYQCQNGSIFTIATAVSQTCYTGGDSDEADADLLWRTTQDPSVKALIKQNRARGQLH